MVITCGVNRPLIRGPVILKLFLWRNQMITHEKNLFNLFWSLLTLIGVVVAFTLATTARAAYQAPPDWFPMEMLGVYFDGTNLSVDSTGFASRLTAHPAGSFDPTKVWAVLNGTAASREFGWYDWEADDFYASYSSLLPAGSSVWIEKTGGSSELKTYSGSGDDNPNGPYTPIFGTAGSSVKWQWDGFMDHNTYAVNLADIRTPNQSFFATYKLYLGDSSGRELSGYGNATTTWNWVGPVSVPEPATAGLLVGAGSLLFRRQRNPEFFFVDR
jgi:hypothetical protein